METSNSNIEAKVISWLAANAPADWPVSSDVPEEKPEKFIVVERTGGPESNVRIEDVDVLIGFYHRTSALIASNMAIEMDKKFRAEFITTQNVSRVQRTSLARVDDTVIKFRRYQAYYSIIHML